MIEWSIETLDKTRMLIQKKTTDRLNFRSVNIEVEPDPYALHVPISVDTVVEIPGMGCKYILLHSSIRRVFVFLTLPSQVEKINSRSGRYQNLLIKLTDKNATNAYYLNIDSLLTAEDVLFCNQGILYPMSKLKRLSS